MRMVAGFQQGWSSACAKPAVQFRNEVCKRSAKAMCWFALVYYKDINSISQIIAGVKRNYEKFAFLARICGEGRWFRVPPPEVSMRCFTRNVLFLLTTGYKVRIIISMKKERNMKQSRTLKFFNKILDISNEIGYNISILRNKINLGEFNMANAKNYTDEMVAQMTAAYTENPSRETVDELANTLGKTTRSIIAKLSREGVYIAQPRTTKSGEPVVAKAELVSAIEEHFGIELPTLVKAGKQDLQRLVDTISQ